MNRSNILLVYYALSQMVFGSQTGIHNNNYNFIMKRELEVKEVSSTSNYLNVLLITLNDQKKIWKKMKCQEV
ncbi:hypothetical protein H312_00507 [Anncaliia algerae PRA339]|uniref:Uncharacterized protein n=1 Tax=Anncaliia algerae PRA339 TaxID=1288291 RepID=A0A059F4B0_9MICR|nr:hypothetical protein H312_00507 [Anncaliia algerae PRA339]